jgi:hypothetical protein
MLLIDNVKLIDNVYVLTICIVYKTQYTAFIRRCRDKRTESNELRAKSKKQEAKSKELRAGNREHGAGIRDPKKWSTEGRELRAESR